MYGENMGQLPATLRWGDFTTAQRRTFKRLLGGWFECSFCGGRTKDPIGHAADGKCFGPAPTCEIRECQQRIHGPAEIIFGTAASARVAHARCYFSAYPSGMVWLW